MVYMAGDNDLDSFCWTDLAELRKVGSNDHLNIVVQIDTIRAKKTRRYHVNRNGTAKSDVIQVLEEEKTGDPKAAIESFTWAARNYPARRYLMGFWNHGSGVDESDVYARTRGGRRSPES